MRHLTRRPSVLKGFKTGVSDSFSPGRAPHHLVVIVLLFIQVTNIVDYSV